MFTISPNFVLFWRRLNLNNPIAFIEFLFDQVSEVFESFGFGFKNVNLQSTAVSIKTTPLAN